MEFLVSCNASIKERSKCWWTSIICSMIERFRWERRSVRVREETCWSQARHISLHVKGETASFAGSQSYDCWRSGVPLTLTSPCLHNRKSHFAFSTWMPECFTMFEVASWSNCFIVFSPGIFHTDHAGTTSVRTDRQHFQQTLMWRSSLDERLSSDSVSRARIISFLQCL